jgi:putative ABC transport system permease protein
MNKHQILENIKISLESIKSHRVRAVITILIIAFGIMALVGILTSIDVIKYSMRKNFAQMGANTLTIKNREAQIHIGGRSNNPKNFRRITYEEAMSFKEQFEFDASVSVYTNATSIATLKYEGEKTNPNISVTGCDENYLMTAGDEIDLGRNFNKGEIQYGKSVVIITHAIANKLFPNSSAIDQIISIGSGKYRVIGILKDKGSSFGMSGDNKCYLPLANVRVYFSRPNMRYTISVLSNNPHMLEAAEGEAEGLFRVIREVPLDEESNFAISKSDNLAEMLMEQMSLLTMVAIIIGAITLVGAAIGLMNIMLVSVTERTREIGIRKSMGANRQTIRTQFLIEAIVIAQIGGFVGVLFGVGIGNLLTTIFGTPIILPWDWIIVGFSLCFIVAIISGFIPANKAANLDPIESLRYE